MQNEGFKDLIIKLGVDLGDREEIKTLIQSREFEIQSLRQKLKMSTIEHVQTTKQAVIEK